MATCARWAVALLGLGVAVGLGGCKSDGDLAGAGANGKSLAIVEQITGSDPGLKNPAVVLVNSREELAVLGSQELVKRDIDWRNQSVVLVAVGEKPTGGYWARIDDVQRNGQTVYVRGTVNRPVPDAPGQAVTQAKTAAYAAAVIPKVRQAKVRSEVASVQGQAFAPATRPAAPAATRPAAAPATQPAAVPARSAAPARTRPAATQPATPGR